MVPILMYKILGNTRELLVVIFQRIASFQMGEAFDQSAQSNDTNYYATCLTDLAGVCPTMIADKFA